MDVQCAKPGKIDQLLRQNIAVRDDDGNVGLHHLERVSELDASQSRRLKARNLLFDRDLLDWRCADLPRATLWLVGPSNDACDVEALTNQRAERRRGKFGRPPEEDAHLQLTFAVVRGPSLKNYP